MIGYHERVFTISHVGKKRNEQIIHTSPGLGMILWARRMEIDEIISSFGSQAKHEGDYLIEIHPPIPRETLRELGGALVEFAKTLDNSPPEPRYEIL